MGNLKRVGPLADFLASRLLIAFCGEERGIEEGRQFRGLSSLAHNCGANERIEKLVALLERCRAQRQRKPGGERRRTRRETEE